LVSFFVNSVVGFFFVRFVVKKQWVGSKAKTHSRLKAAPTGYQPKTTGKPVHRLTGSPNNRATG
jgi:hypothetical protein